VSVVDATAVQPWEQGRRRPDRTARILLAVIATEPGGGAKGVGIQVSFGSLAIMGGLWTEALPNIVQRRIQKGSIHWHKSSAYLITKAASVKQQQHLISAGCWQEVEKKY
jgi:hypothetical protein